MVGKQINIDPKEKTVDIFVDDITINELKDVLNHFNGMEDYEFRVHNPQQTTSLFYTYNGNVSIDKLMPDRKFFGSEHYYDGSVIREHYPDPELILNNKNIIN